MAFTYSSAYCPPPQVDCRICQHNDDLNFLCNSLNLDMRAYIFSGGLWLKRLRCLCFGLQVMRWWKANIGSLGEQFQIVGELICFNVWYHILYKIIYFFVVPYQVQRVQYCAYDFIAHRWNGSILAIYKLENTNG
jgi:hypothetical protein